MKRPSAPISPGTPASPSKRRATAKRPAAATTPDAPATTSPQVDRETVQSKAQQLAAKLADERRHAAWLSGFRFSAFSLIMAGVLSVGILSMIPRIQEIVTQRQQIDALNAEIAAAKADIAAKENERQQWNDRAFIETQARERLYYVEPGDISFLVINDLSPGQLTQQTAATATDAVQQTESHWLGSLLGSVWAAGNAPGPAPTTAPATPEPTGAAQ